MAHDMFILLEGITGGSKDKAMAKYCDVLSFSWGMVQSGSMHVGGGGGAGKVFVHDMSFTKYSDKASGTILQYCASGTHITTATLVVRRAGGTPVEDIKMVMTNVIITSVSVGGGAGDDLYADTITLNFASVTYTADSQTSTGSGEGGSILNYDILGNNAGA